MALPYASALYFGHVADGLHAQKVPRRTFPVSAGLVDGRERAHARASSLRDAAGSIPIGQRSFHGLRQRRLLFTAIGIAEIVLIWLGGRAADVLQLAAVTGVSWFLAGALLSQTAVLVGLAAEPEDRGIAFGILGMTNGLGTLIGGLGVGYIADRFGYRGAFDGLAVFCLLIVVGGLISIESPGSFGLRARPRGCGRGTPVQPFPAPPSGRSVPGRGDRRSGKPRAILLDE